MDTLKEYFNPARTGYLARIMLAAEGKPFMWAGIIVGCFQIMNGLIAGLGGRPQNYTGYLKVAFFIGMILISRIFRNLHEKESGTYLLTLPGSIGEKYLIRLLGTALGYYLYSIMVVTVVSVLSGLANMAVFGRPFAMFNPASIDLGRILGQYLLVHSFVFAGAILFRRFTLFKTAVSVWLFTMITSVFFLAVFRLFVYPELFNLQAVIPHLMNLQMNPSPHLKNGTAVQFKIVMTVLVPLLLYTAGYFRMREYQVKG